MRVYLDICCIGRLLDDKTQPRVIAEAEAVLELVAAREAGRLEFASSTALEYETRRDPDPIRRRATLDILGKAAVVGRISAAVVGRAHILQGGGIKALDAYHLSFAAEVGADFFCSCDDRLIRRARVIHPPPPEIVTPLELIRELKR